MRIPNQTVFFVMLGCSIVFPAIGSDKDNDWINSYIVVDKTEIVNRDQNGNVNSIVVVKDSKVSVRRKVTETRTVNSAGEERVISRRIETYDSLGGSVVVVEGEVEGYVGLVPVSMTTVVKLPGGTVTTVQCRNGVGSMPIASRVTTAKDNDGATTTVVEAPDKHGNLVEVQTTTHYRESSKQK